MTIELTPTQWCKLALQYREMSGDSLQSFIDDISLKIDCHPETFARRCREALTWLSRWTEAGLINNDELPPETYEEQHIRLCQSIRRGTKPFNQTIAQVPNSERSIIVLADLHGDIKQELRDAVIARKPTIVVIAGDVLDMLAYSKFPKRYHEPPSYELQRIISLLELLASLGIYVIIILGNHDHRYWSYHAEHLDPFAMDDVRMHPLHIAAMGMPSVEVVCDVYDYETPTGLLYEGQVAVDFFTYIGDLLVAHPTKSRKHPGGTARVFAEDFNGWLTGLRANTLTGWRTNVREPGLPRVIAVGHRHTFNLGPSNMRQTLVELGFAGQLSTHAYAWNRGHAPGYGIEPGYLYLEQVKDESGRWVTIIPSVQYNRV
jgi:predicted phosphodiesterase